MADDARLSLGLSLHRAQLRAPDVGSRGTDGRAIGDRIGAAPVTEHDRRVATLIGRLRDVSGIRLEEYWVFQPKASWPSNTPGFAFMSVSTEELGAALVASGRFAPTDSPSAPVQRFREINADPRSGSLHITLQGRAGSPSEVHLDSISIVRAKDPRTGAPVYTPDPRILMTHYAVDKEGHRSDEVFFPW